MRFEHKPKAHFKCYLCDRNGFVAEQKSSEEVEPDTDGEGGNERRGWNDRYGIQIRCAEISGTRVGNESLNPIAEVNTRCGCLRSCEHRSDKLLFSNRVELKSLKGMTMLSHWTVTSTHFFPGGQSNEKNNYLFLYLNFTRNLYPVVEIWQPVKLFRS